MNYGLIYTISFATLRNESCTIEIEKEDYVGEVMELIPAGSPFTVEIDDDDFAYVPTRFSTANIRVVGSDYLQHLYSTSYQQYRVTFKRDGIVTWCGFIKPELYTQDYSSALFELEIECQSAMSTLEFIPYKQMKEGGKDFVSLWNLVKKGIELSNARYNAVYIPYVYSKSESDYKASTDNVLSEMTVSEQDFFDEDDKAMTNKEVLEEICKLLNWTCVDWKGELYFVDMDYQGDYRRYSSNLETWEPVSLPGVLNVQKAGFAGNDHTLDLVPGFNKVTVKTSNYPINNAIPEEDIDELKILSITDISEGEKVSHRRYKIPCKWDMKQYTYDRATLTLVENLESYQGKIDVGNLLGALPLQYCNYEVKDGNPNIRDYNYTDVIQIRQRLDSTFSGFDNKHSILVLKGVTGSYSDGALSISGSVKFFVDKEMSPLRNADISSSDLKTSDQLLFRLRIGQKYFNGSVWVDEIASFRLPYEQDNNSEYIPFRNTKTLSMPYTGLSGYVIPISEQMVGELVLELIGINLRGKYPNGEIPYGVFLKDFKLVYQKEDNLESEESNSDRYYENVLNEDYINELDEIEFKISSYNNDGACYSKVIIRDKYLEDNLYSVIEEKLIRPEEQLIRRIINRYSDIHIKLTQEIQEVPELIPITRLSDSFMVNKIFVNIGGSIDYKMGKFRCVMIEA